MILRTDARYAEYWEPTTGKRFRLEAVPGESGLAVKLLLRPEESGFIIASNYSLVSIPLRIDVKETVDLLRAIGLFYFDPQWGGPGEVVFPKLIDWTQNEDKRIRYYSGTAIYRKIFN